MVQLLWNSSAQEQVKSFLSHNQSSQKPLFLILIGPEGIGKTTFFRQLAQELLGQTFSSDFLWMRDLSTELWKLHTLQVEMPSALKTIPLENGTQYENKGVRELNAWLQQSSLSGKKILLIENLQRMSNAAMNAFLKTCEEPLSNRFLFATAEHESWILPTILSRAMVIRFSPLLDSEMRTYLEQDLHFTGNEQQKQLLIALALGKPGTLHQLLEKWETLPELFESMLQLNTLLYQQGQRHLKLQLFKKIEENWLLETFLTMLIKELTEAGKIEDAESWIKVKQLISANISQENALWYGILSQQS